MKYILNRFKEEQAVNHGYKNSYELQKHYKINGFYDNSYNDWVDDVITEMTHNKDVIENFSGDSSHIIKYVNVCLNEDFNEIIIEDFNEIIIENTQYVTEEQLRMLGFVNNIQTGYNTEYTLGLDYISVDANIRVFASTHNRKDKQPKFTIELIGWQPIKYKLDSVTLNKGIPQVVEFIAMASKLRSMVDTKKEFTNFLESK